MAGISTWIEARENGVARGKGEDRDVRDQFAGIGHYNTYILLTTSPLAARSLFSFFLLSLWQHQPGS